MTRRSSPFSIEAGSGDRCADLSTAQQAALRPMASDLAAIVRRLLADGELQIHEGRIIPAATAEGKAHE